MFLTSWIQQRLFYGHMLTALENTINKFKHIILEVDYPTNEERENQHYNNRSNSHIVPKDSFLTMILF